MSESRGLGFVWTDEKYGRTGGLFENGAVGHGGYTGQSVFADPRSGLYVIILSDATACSCRKHGGREKAEETRQCIRDIHNAIKLDMELV